jgi:hypothetical protein
MDTEFQEEIMDESEEVHVKILKKLLTDKHDKTLDERRLFEGQLDRLYNEEFGPSGIFGDQQEASFQDLREYLKTHLRIQLDQGVIKAS